MERTTKQEKIDFLKIVFFKVDEVILYNKETEKYEPMYTKDLDPVKVAEDIESTRNELGEAKSKMFFMTYDQELAKRSWDSFKRLD